jgi:hypothetical protein
LRVERLAGAVQRPRPRPDAADADTERSPGPQ